jgi:hypothetical protein
MPRRRADAVGTSSSAQAATPELQPAAASASAAARVRAVRHGRIAIGPVRTMVAYYHATSGDYRLDHGHTVPIGRPWIRGSSCDHLLLSLPYPWGPELETCTVRGLLNNPRPRPRSTNITCTQ